MKLLELAEEYGTPLYLLDYDKLAERMKWIRSWFGDDMAYCYAMKANPFLVDELQKYNVKYEVCSPGEFSICEEAGIDLSKVVLSGVYKSAADVDHIMKKKLPVDIFTVESKEQLHLLQNTAHRYGRKIKVLLRLTSGNQFGMDEKLIKKIIGHKQQYDALLIKGIHFYSGTQKRKCAAILSEIDYLDHFCQILKEETGFELEELEYGPGLPVLYFTSGADSDDTEFISNVSMKLKPLSKKYKLTLELGRYMAAACGTYLSRVVDIKSNQDENYCIIDGGIHHINYYGQVLALKTPKIEILTRRQEQGAEKKRLWNICGSLCTAGDILAKEYAACELHIGDVLVFHNIGAYSITEGIYLFLSRNLPKVLAYSSEKGIEILRDEMPTYRLNSKLRNH